jgi:hypothetical protein
MAPDIPKVDPNRHLDPGTAEWNFRDKLMRWLFHGNSLSDLKTCSSHFSASSFSNR